MTAIASLNKKHNENILPLAKRGARDPAVNLNIPRTQTQLQGKTKHQIETRRQQQESTERQEAVSVSEGTPH